MRFELLGSLRVVDGGCDVTPARPKQRALLALLLLRRGEVVAGAQLIEALWGEARSRPQHAFSQSPVPVTRP